MDGRDILILSRVGTGKTLQRLFLVEGRVRLAPCRAGTIRYCCLRWLEQGVYLEKRGANSAARRPTVTENCAKKDSPFLDLAMISLECFLEDLFLSVPLPKAVQKWRSAARIFFFFG